MGRQNMRLSQRLLAALAATLVQAAAGHAAAIPVTDVVFSGNIHIPGGPSGLGLTNAVVLYDSSSEVAHHLNPVATLVWELCDGRTVSEIVQAVAEVLEIPDDEAKSVVNETYGPLSTSRLLV